MPSIPWLFPPGVFTDTVSVWRKTTGPSPGGGGELTETWAAVAEDWSRSKVVPMSESDQLELGVGYRGATYFVYLVAADDGTLPDVVRGDHLTWTDRKGRVRTFSAHYSVDEGEIGVCLRVVCSELRVQ